MKQNQLPPQFQLMQFIVGKWISKPIYVAAELGLADMLADGPQNLDVLAQKSGAHAPSLYRMMRALASVGIFSETRDKYFELTPMADLLKTGAMRSIAIMFNAEWSDMSWGRFMDNIKSGQTAFEIAYGTSVSNWLEKNSKAACIFNEANAIKAAGTHRVIVDVYDFSKFKTLIDIGGGTGALMVEILTANHSLQGVVADIPMVVKEAEKTIHAKGLEDRCQTVVCDFFKSVPEGGDAYLMSHILHDWPDDVCQTILEKCYQAMMPSSILLIVEMIIPPGNEPSIAKLLDLEMMVTTGGKERTESEFRQLLSKAGFALNRIIPTHESISIIEAVRS